jgi:cytosol alanyl aminopeptidase
MKLLLCFVIAALVGVAKETPTLRLPEDVRPVRYELQLGIMPGQDTFTGTVAIDVQVKKAVPVIWLNSAGLKIASAKVDGKPAKVITGTNEFLGVEGDKPFSPGAARIEIAYSGAFQKNDVEGLFKQTDGEASYIFTQFEPISARRAMPCFDEPGFKTPWRITLRVPKDMQAFANTPIEGETVEGDTKLVRFRESKPLPSYLVALAVGPFEIIDGGKAGKSNTPLRVITTRGHRDEVKYALEVTPKVFTALENYFGVPYPYEKLDQITIPVTVAFGAMENAGLITYQSAILAMRPQDDTVARRRSTTEVITHEIAHQWFGNMVTPAWWDDIWLNEAFATWLTERIEEQNFPEWKEDVAAVSSKSAVMGTDTLLSARKIRQPIASEGDIGSAFDDITYNKGAAVIRMFENYVGPEQFRKGIQNYIRKHQWGNATANDFMRAISEASGKNVTAAFSTFLDRTGVPLLSVSMNCKPGSKPSVTVAQERLLPLGSKGSRAEYWQVPACFEYEANGKISRQCNMIADPKDTVVLQSASGCPAWLNANEGGTGYYRVRYEGAAQQKLVDHVEKLELREKVDLLKNASALVAAGQMPAGEALALVPKFKDSTERELVNAALEIAGGMKRVVPPSLKPNYDRFVLAMFDAKARSLGMELKAGESDDARLLRPALVAIVAEHGDTELNSKAREVAERWLKDRKSVSPDIAGTALDIAAGHGDRAFFDRLVTELHSTKDRRDRSRIVRAIGSFRDPEIAKSGLQLQLDPTLDIRDIDELLYAYNREPETERLAWPFLVANYDKILSRLPSRLGNHAGADLPFVGGAFCDEKGYTEVQSFFREKVKSMPGAKHSLGQVLERIQACGPRRAAQKSEVAKFLANW